MWIALLQQTYRSNCTQVPLSFFLSLSRRCNRKYWVVRWIKSCREGNKLTSRRSELEGSEARACSTAERESLCSCNWSSSCPSISLPSSSSSSCPISPNNPTRWLSPLCTAPGSGRRRRWTIQDCEIYDVLPNPDEKKYILFGYCYFRPQIFVGKIIFLIPDLWPSKRFSS